VRGGDVDPLGYSVFRRPVGELDAEQAWLGCRRARFDLCRPPEPGWRAREEASWRHAELHRCRREQAGAAVAIEDGVEPGETWQAIWFPLAARGDGGDPCVRLFCG
jgi:hypothetical protein